MTINPVSFHMPPGDKNIKTETLAPEKLPEISRQNPEAPIEKKGDGSTEAARFDRYIKGEEAPESKQSPSTPAEEKPEMTKTTVSTDQVDHEIKNLKKQIQEVQRQLQSEEQKDRRDSLEQRLQTLEAELATKDNDSYRKQHASVITG